MGVSSSTLDTRHSTQRRCDVLVIGGGGAGALAAIEASKDEKLTVMLLSKGPIGMSSWTATVCDSVYFRMPSAPCRRPIPEAFMPPIGASTDPQAAAKPSLMLAVPVRICTATFRPRHRSRVQTLAFSP